MLGKTGRGNSVRSGLAYIKYEHIRRIDISSGNLTKGINYSSISVPNATTPVNGLLPDTCYSVLLNLEDCPFSRTVSVPNPLKGIYIPHNISVLNSNSPTDDTSTATFQHLFLLITSAPPEKTITRITIIQNWEGTKTQNYSDVLILSENCFSNDLDGKYNYEYIILSWNSNLIDSTK